MSWSLTFIGNPSKVSDALFEFGEKLDGYSKEEYDAVAPALIALVSQNFGTTYVPTIKISASGHGYATDGVVQQRQCVVSIEVIPGAVIV